MRDAIHCLSPDGASRQQSCPGSEPSLAWYERPHSKPCLVCWLPPHQILQSIPGAFALHQAGPFPVLCGELVCPSVCRTESAASPRRVGAGAARPEPVPSAWPDGLSLKLPREGQELLGCAWERGRGSKAPRQLCRKRPPKGPEQIGPERLLGGFSNDISKLQT